MMFAADPFEAESAVIESLQTGGYCERITRADGANVPINCETAESAAELIAAMDPAECFVFIPESPSRDAMLHALGDDGHSEAPRTLH